jgi:hypothetical protein
MVSAKTEIHEIGHSFRFGRADDRYNPKTLLRNGEIYSGRDSDLNPTLSDRTPETVGGTQTWSIMSSGYRRTLAIEPMNGRFFVFSIEEASTANER